MDSPGVKGLKLNKWKVQPPKKIVYPPEMLRHLTKILGLSISTFPKNGDDLF